MSRSIWKNLKIVQKSQKYKSNTLKIWRRSDIITSSLIGKTVFIYNGKLFKKLLISREKIGYKYGEFSLTRSYKMSTQKVTKSLKKF